MDPMVVGAAVGGLVVGGVLVWALLSGRLKAATDGLRTAQTEADAARDALQKASVGLAVAEERAGRAAATEASLIEVQAELAELKQSASAQEAVLREREERITELRQTLEESKTALADTFKALSQEALQGTSKQFFEQAEAVLARYKESNQGELDQRKQAIEEMLKPLRDRLVELDQKNQEMERARSMAYGDIKQQIQLLTDQQTGFQQATTRLTRALQDPGAAGNWGEMVLERVLEMAGLEEGMHFELQETQATEDGRQRPDVLVKLPGGRTIVVDSKAPMKSYLAAQEEAEQTNRETLLKDHAGKLLGHAKTLGSRNYSRRQDTTDFVVLFVPSEAAFRAAVEAQTDVIERALEVDVFIATPTTLLALLRAVGYGWRQEKFTQEARKVQENGQALYESLVTLFSHYEKLGRALQSAVRAHNDFGGSLERNVLPKARRFKELGVEGRQEIADPEPIEATPRALAAPEASPSLFVE
jgi:DNA recombination protein RmuC